MQRGFFYGEIPMNSNTLFLGSCVYHLYNNGELIYIGSTNNIYRRIGVHLNNIVFDRYIFFECNDSDRYEKEAEAIIELSPRLNETLPHQSGYVSQKQAKRIGVSAKTFKNLWRETKKLTFNGFVYVTKEELSGVIND